MINSYLKMLNNLFRHKSTLNFEDFLDWQSNILSYGNAGVGNHSPLTGPNMTNRQGSASVSSDGDESNRKRQVRLLKNR